MAEVRGIFMERTGRCTSYCLGCGAGLAGGWCIFKAAAGADVCLVLLLLCGFGGGLVYI